MKTHLVHEWLAERAGSELVVEAMLESFPQSPLHALGMANQRAEAGYLPAKAGAPGIAF